MTKHIFVTGGVVSGLLGAAVSAGIAVPLSGMDGRPIRGEPSEPPPAIPLGKSRAELLDKLRGCPPAVVLPSWFFGLPLRLLL